VVRPSGKWSSLSEEGRETVDCGGLAFLFARGRPVRLRRAWSWSSLAESDDRFLQRRFPRWRTRLRNVRSEVNTAGPSVASLR
jgi:hypothetical protein